MASLALFRSQPSANQTANKQFGFNTATSFRITSSFGSTIAAPAKAFAMVKGTILLQQQIATDKVNLILRPHDQSNLKLPVKYIVYRGLKTLDFVDNENLSAVGNKVKTSGLEVLVKMKEIQDQRAPSDEIPVQALFGHNLSPSNAMNIDDFFFKELEPNSQLFTIDCGVHIGNLITDDSGIDIILENPEYKLTVKDAKESLLEIILLAGDSTEVKKWKKDLVRHFVDPAAFYGLHYDIKGGIQYKTAADVLNIADSVPLVYNQVINRFTTKNNLYLDIRNENGYSYNYYGNYLGTGTDANKNVRIGQTATTLVPKEYYNTNGWSLHIVSVTPGSGVFNEIFMELRLNDNTKPLLAAWNYKVEKHNSSGKIISDQNVHYADEAVLLPNPVTEFTNKVSFNVPNVVGGTPAQLATIVRLDYVRQPDTATSAVKFPRKKFTDFLFGSTNLEIPWDTDDKIAWYTANYRTYINAIDDLGFGGIIEAGHIIDIDQSTSDNDRIILYAAPLNFFSYKGIEKAIPFSAKGGVLNFDSVLNMVPGTTINRTNLIISGTESILTLSYQFDTKLKKALFMLGVTKTEWQAMLTATASTLSNIHLKLFKLHSDTGAKTDTVGTTYYDYEIVISGLDSTGVYQEINTGIMVYTLDHLIFSSKLFGEKYQIDYTEAENNLNDFIDNWKFEKLSNYTFEEKNMLEVTTPTSNGAKNKILLEKDSSFLNEITEFKTALDGVSNYDNLKNLLKEKGSDLFLHAKTSIKIETGDSYNKDAFLYLSRLRMQVILKNHPYVLINFNQKIRELYNIFELNSRGLSGAQKPDFSLEGTGVKKILISGFDPFDIGGGSIGKDWEGDISNPSGNIALSMGDVELKVGNIKKAIIKSVIFPVRWEDFDNGLPIEGATSKGIVEDFFESYFSGANKPDMIITFSYGVHYNKDIDHDFHLERFAANWQSYSNDNNGEQNFNHTKRASYDKPNYVKKLSIANKDRTFIESTLPFHKLENPSGSGKIKVGTNFHTVVNHGPISSNGLNWEVWGRNISSGDNENISNDIVVPYQPSEFFPIPFESLPITGAGYGDVDYMKDHEDKAYFLGRFLVCDNTIIKYFHPKPTPSTPNQYYIPLPTWEKYQTKSFTTHDNIRIEARKGSGGTYMSNLIFYRVAYLREEYGNTIPMGHIHMGFNKSEDDRFDPHSGEANLRKKMLDDVKEMLKKFNDI